MIGPTLEALAVDPRSIDLIVEAQGSATDVVSLNDCLVPLLAAELPAAQVERAVRIARSCMARAAVQADPGDVDHDQLTDAAQDGWDR